MKPSEVIRICISIKGIATMNPINTKEGDPKVNND